MMKAIRNHSKFISQECIAIPKEEESIHSYDHLHPEGTWQFKKTAMSMKKCHAYNFEDIDNIF